MSATGLIGIIFALLMCDGSWVVVRNQKINLKCMYFFCNFLCFKDYFIIKLYMIRHQKES